MTNRPAHLGTLSDGSLYDRRAPFGAPSIRQNYVGVHYAIKSVADLKACLRYGKFIDGGYPTFFITADGDCLSHEGVREWFAAHVNDIWHRASGRIVALDINYECQDLFCCATGEQIPAAYGDDND